MIGQKQQIMYAVVSKKKPTSIHSIHLSKWHAKGACRKLSEVVRVGVYYDIETKTVTVRGHEYQKIVEVEKV